MLGLGEDSGKKSIVAVVVKLEVYVRDGEDSLYLGIFLLMLGSGVLVSDGGVCVAFWGRNVSLRFKGRIVSWSVVEGTCCRGGGGGGDLLSEADDGVYGPSPT